jgi:hypothetical protein
LEVIKQLKIKLDEPLKIHKDVTNISGNKSVVKDFNKIPNELVNVSGVYILYLKERNFFYIGSASSLGARFKQHVINFSRPYRGGNSKLYIFFKDKRRRDQKEGQAILINSNPLIEFLNKNPNFRLSLNDKYILRSLNQIERKFLEQALISHFKPKLNSYHSIFYSLINWNLNYSPTFQINVIIKAFNASNGPITDSIFNKNIGFITEFESIVNASTGLGVSKTSISRYINTISLLESPLLELEVFIVDTSRPLTNKTVSFEDIISLAQITDFDLYSPPMGKLVALNSNKDFVNY